MQNKKKQYEYELCIARLDPSGGAIKVSMISLSRTSAFSFGAGFGFCGLGICSIQARSQAQDQAKVAEVPLLPLR